MKTEKTFNVRNKSILDHNPDNASQALAESELPLTEVLEKNPADVLLALLTRTQPAAGIMVGDEDDFDEEETDDIDDDDDLDDDEEDADEVEEIEEVVEEEEADEEWEMDEDFDEDAEEVDLDDED